MWAWMSAARRGVSHVRANTRLQDARATFVCPGNSGAIFVGVVSDGAGSAEFGGEGASLVVRTLTTYLRNWLRQTGGLPGREDFAYWSDQIRDRLSQIATRKNSSIREFAATLVCVVCAEDEAVIAHIGDGCVVLKLAGAGDWVAPSWPHHGEYASTTSFISDQPEVRLVVERVNARVESLVVFSDGLERLALNFGSMTPHSPFFELVLRPLAGIESTGRQSELSRALGDFLDSEQINSRTDDDKSIIVALRK
jgi:hypothetical protein